jgi:hypothetical protein
VSPVGTGRHCAGLLAGALAVISTVTAQQPAGSEWLSDHLELIAAHSQSWGLLGIDTCAHALGQTPLPLQIGAHRYGKGLGLHANGEVVVELGGAFARFQAEVGVQQQQGTAGSVVFKVIADDVVLFTSAILHPADAAVAVDVALTGREELRLVATDAGDGITCDCADWADARLVRAAAATAKAPSAATDVAPFAAVRSWNWHELEGTRAGRLDEFPAADLQPWTEVVRDTDGFAVAVRDGFACIGLEWREPRRLARMELATAARADGVRVEQWIGQAGAGSTWQGRWQRIEGELRVANDRLVLEPSLRADANLLVGTTKIRWIVPATAGAAAAPLRVRELRAFSRSRWQDVELALSVEPARSGQRATIRIHNGSARSGAAGAPIEWDLGVPLRLALSACASRHARGDRTVLRFELPQMSFGLAVDDVLANGGVFVADAGLYVTDAQKPLALAAYRQRFAGRRTVLEDVRTQPDQTLAASTAHLHHREQDLGPTLLSLPADNRKFIVERDGTVRWDDRAEVVDCVDHPPAEPYRCAAVVRFGDGRAPASERELVDLSCLGLELRHRDGAVQYSMQALVTPPATGELRLAAENTGDSAASIAFEVRLAHPAGVHVALASDGRSSVVEADGHVLAWLSAGADATLAADADGCTVRATLAAHARITARVVIPRWRAGPADLARVPDLDAATAAARRAWQTFLGEMAHIEVPDPQLDRIIHASVLHCLAAARTSVPTAEQVGPRIAPWIASVSYGPLESEAQAVIRGMQALGARSFAMAAHHYFADRVDASGRLTTGYTLLGTGWHLWTFGEYDQLFADDATLAAVAESLVRACRWITAQRHKSVPGAGLMPPGPLADWDCYARYFYANANYCAGLRDAAAALARIGEPQAAAIAAEAQSFRSDILRGLDAAAARAPVVPLRDGRWVPYFPTQADGSGPTEEFHPGEDAGRSWCYDIEVGAAQLIALGLLEPRSPQAGWIVDHQEDVQFLRDGWFAYPAVENVQHPFVAGGFAKVQPYYARTVEIHGLRDDVAPFVRSWLNTIPTLLDREDLSLWEHFAAYGAWNKTHETGYFLWQTRTLLLTERGDELWLAPFVPRAWLADGKVIALSNAPTRFGPAGYRIESHVAERHIDVTIDPPQRRPPKALVLRLRHPEGAPIRSAAVDGVELPASAHGDDTIHLAPAAARIALRVAY